MRRVLGLLALLLVGRPVDAAPDAKLRSTAVAKLTALVADPDRGVRYAAIQALGKAGEPPGVWGRGIEDAFCCVRQETGWWLRRAGDAAIPFVEKALAREQPVEVRASAAWTLSGLGARAVPLLRKALADPDPRVRTEAVASTRRLGVEHGKVLLPVIRAAYAERPDDPEIVRTLVELAPSDADDALIARLRRAHSLPHEAGDLFRALLRAGPAADRVLDAFAAQGKDWSRQVGWAREAHTEAVAAASLPPVEIPPAPTPRAVAPIDPAELDVLSRELREGTVADRIRAALTLGERRADAARIVSALGDPERDVRMAAAIALARATGDASTRLVAALTDTNARVRRLAIKALGVHRRGAEEVAPFLADPDPATSEEAVTTLIAIGPSAAAQVAREAARGHYGALHHASTYFDAIGESAARAVPFLLLMIANDDVNVREYAARGLRALGPAAGDGVRALVRALSDDRLCVVANAALALGRTGLSTAMIEALDDPRARVRAYAAFAVGWALGDLRRLDQVPFEVRLPVTDAGGSVPDPTDEELSALEASDRGDDVLRNGRKVDLRRWIWSRDAKIALRAAVLLEHGDLDARESERAMEILLPEGMRRGSTVDFERVRETIGSSELPAAMMYVYRARDTDPSRESIFGTLHRTSRADTIPAILWFERNEEPEAIEGSDGIYQPFGYTAKHAREILKDFLGRIVAGDDATFVRAVLRRLVERKIDRPEGSELWLLNAFDPAPEDAGALVALAKIIEPELDEHEHAPSLVVVLRALGRCADPESMAFLRVQTRSAVDDVRLTALGALARRGDAEASATLIGLAAAADDDPFLALADAQPRAAAAWLAARLVGPDPPWVAGLFANGSHTATNLGLRLSDEAYLGIESVLVERLPSPLVVGPIAARVPGCATRRLAMRVFEVLDANGGLALLWPDRDQEADEFNRPAADDLAAFLVAANRERALRFLRRTAENASGRPRDWAFEMLTRLGDTTMAAAIVDWAKSRSEHEIRDEHVDRVRAPEVAAYFAEAAAAEKGEDRDEPLEHRARALGWPRELLLEISMFSEEKRDGVRTAIVAGDLAAVRAAYPVPARLEGRAEPGAESWERIGRDALRGDRTARAGMWSALRAARLRWIHTNFLDDLQTFGNDPSTLPHWIHDLESNCCRVSDGLADGAFERPYGIPHLYGTERNGVGRPLPDLILEWFRFYGARWVWSPILDRFVPEPE